MHSSRNETEKVNEARNVSFGVESVDEGGVRGGTLGWMSGGRHASPR